MGGWGSNRWGTYERKSRVEEALTLESAEFCKIPPGTILQINWGRKYRSKAKRINDGLFVTYNAKKENETIAETIPLIFNNRSNRWYWNCPDCASSITKLYLPPGKWNFRCRHCHNLTYRSIQERRKYQSLARLLAKGTDIPPKQMERFFTITLG